MRLLVALLAGVTLAAPTAPAAADAPGEQPCVPNTTTPAWCGDGGPARHAGLVHPTSIARMADGSVLIYESRGDLAVVRRVRPDGVIVRAAGTGQAGSSGDGGSAIAARISAHGSIAATPDGGFLIAEADTHRVRRVSPGGVIVTVAGTGVAGSGGDRGPAVAARLNAPRGVAATADGGYVIADAGDGHLRRVSAAGTISTLAVLPPARIRTAGGRASFSLATLTRGRVAFSGGSTIAVAGPTGKVSTVYRLPRQAPAITALAGAPDGTILFTYDGSVRQLGTDGAVPLWVAGSDDTKCTSYPPDGAPALIVTLDDPVALAVAPDATVYVADAADARVRAFVPGGGMTTLAGGGGAPLRGECSVGAERRPPQGSWDALLLLSPKATRSGVTAGVLTSLAGVVTITIRSSRGIVATARRPVSPGKNPLSIRVALRPGSRYTISLSGRSSGGLTKSVRAQGFSVRR